MKIFYTIIYNVYILKHRVLLSARMAGDQCFKDEVFKKYYCGAPISQYKHQELLIHQNMKLNCN